MRRLCFAVTATLLVVASAALAAPTDEVAPHVLPLQRILPLQRTFPDLSYLFGFIAEAQGLGKANDWDLSRRISASSSERRLRDHSVDPIIVVKADLRGADGKSRLRSPTGNYPFYVLRSTRGGFVLLGEMYGRGYAAHFDGRVLRFKVKLSTGPDRARALSYVVDRNSLVNLSAPPTRAPYLAAAHH